MSRRLKKLRKELERRRRQIEYEVKKSEQRKPLVMLDRLETENEANRSYFATEEGQKNQSEFFIFRILLSVCLFFVIAIIFKINAPQFAPVREFVQHTYEQEFQFATIAHWYESQFGRPLALIPVQETPVQTDDVPVHYALPANGVIYEDFSENGRGVVIETEVDAKIEAIRGGYVIAVGEDREGKLGKTVTVQHFDGTESVYGMLNTIDVNIYDHIEAGTTIGTVSTDEQEMKGFFYLGLKENNHYIDPSDVLPFE